MKKFIYIGLFSIILGYNVKAQNYQVFNQFMKEYTSNWEEGYRNPQGNTMEFIQQVGTQGPKFYFDKELNSDALKGKFIVLTFWSTWCGSCRTLIHDLDSILFKKMIPYQDVQVIGVDCHETVSLKKAKQWWKENGINYPSVYGKAADACQQSYRGGHPVTILLDHNGIIRSRWNGWSPHLAEMVKFAIWALKIQPTTPFNIDDIKRHIAKGNFMEALYILESEQEDIQHAALKYLCKLSISERSANHYFHFLQERYSTSPQYWDLMTEILYTVYNSNNNSEAILKNGIEASKVLIKSPKIKDYKLRQAIGTIYCRYGECCKKIGIISLKNSLQIAKEKGADPESLQKLEETLKQYENPLE